TFYLSSRTPHTRFSRDWSSDVSSSHLNPRDPILARIRPAPPDPEPPAPDPTDPPLPPDPTDPPEPPDPTDPPEPPDPTDPPEPRSEERRVGKHRNCASAASETRMSRQH